MLWRCVWRRGSRGNNAVCPALGRLSFTSSATHKHIGPFWCWFLGRWACVHSRTLWVSPTNSPVRMEVSPATPTSTGLFSQRFWDFISPCWDLGLRSQSCSPVVPPGYPHANVGPLGPPATTLPALVHQLLPCGASPPPWLPISAPPTSLDECFFFNSLVVRLPYSSIFW